MTRAREELILTFSGEMSSLVRQIPADMLMRESDFSMVQLVCAGMARSF